MDLLETNNNNNCRICLEQHGLLDWKEKILDFCETTYKYCYYKYTQLDEKATDTLPQRLCQTCSNDLRNTHILIQKALQSHEILRQTSTDDIEEKNIVDEKINPSNFEIEDDNDNIEYIHFATVETSLEDTKETDISNIKLEKDHEFNEDMEFLTDNEKSCNTKSKKNLKEKKTKRKASDKLSNHPDFPADVEVTVDIPKVSEEDTPKPSSSKKPRKKTHLICSYCSKIVVAENIRAHERTHEDRERLQVCPKCGIKLFNKASMYMHMQVHKENREKKYKCEFCEKAYYNRGALNVHRRIHLGQMIPCTLCSKEFFRQVDLDKHMPSHSATPLHINVKKLQYYVECQDCGKNVPTSRYKDHHDMHLKKYQMQCTICTKHFVSKKSCHKHMRSVHKKTKEEYPKLVIYYGENLDKRTSHLLRKQLDQVKPIET